MTKLRVLVDVEELASTHLRILDGMDQSGAQNQQMINAFQAQLPTCRDAEEGTHQHPEPDPDDSNVSSREPRVEGPVNEGDSFETVDDEEGINPAVTLTESSSGLRGGNKRVMTCDLANVSLAAPKTSP